MLGRDLPPPGDLSALGNCTQGVAFPPLLGESREVKSWKGRVWGGATAPRREGGLSALSRSRLGNLRQRGVLGTQGGALKQG